MALLKFRKATLAEYMAIVEKDPDTRYTVYNEDGSLYGEFIGADNVADGTSTKVLDAENSFVLFDAVGGIKDSGKKLSEFVTMSEDLFAVIDANEALILDNANNLIVSNDGTAILLN